MTIEEFFGLLEGIHPISDDFKAELKRVLLPLSFPKGRVLVQPPNVASHAYFLVSGFAISFTYVEGERSIDWFWQGGEFIVPAKSFIDQIPSNEIIELVQPCELLCIEYHNLFKMFEVYPEAHYLYRVIISRHFAKSRDLILDLKSRTAEQRYQGLLKKIASIEQILSQEQIASYLGITPQSLSRMKRRRS